MTDDDFVEPEIIHGDARDLPVPDASVDLVITSPPYFGLRTYRDGDTAYRGQLGAEDTPGAYLENLIACTREMIRVLKPSGSIFVNLGDKYSSYTSGSGTDRSLSGPRGTARVPDGGNPHNYAVPAKSLIGLPWRYALRCIDELGLILRAEITWNKPHGLPESVREHGLTEAHLSALLAAGLNDTPRALDTQGRPGGHEHPGGQLVAEARAALGGYAREFLLSRATEFADTCDCADTSAASVPGVVLDPFGGTGTTALAAAVHGRRAISLDASRDYGRLATWRVHDLRQQARARGTQRAPEPVPHAA